VSLAASQGSPAAKALINQAKIAFFTRQVALYQNYQTKRKT